MYNLKYIIPLTGIYSMKLYQYLKEAEFKNDKRRTFVVDELMDLMQVPPSLKNYADFKRKVLQVAEKELKEHLRLKRLGLNEVVINRPSEIKQIQVNFNLE